MTRLHPDASHLAIDGVGAKYGGGATVLLDLVQAALACPELSRISVFCSPAASRQFRFPSHPALELHERPTIDASRPARVWWFEAGLARDVRRLGAGKLICLGGGGVPPKGVVSATFVQRNQPFSQHFWSSARPFERLRTRTLQATIARSARTCSWVFVQTETMRTQVVDELKIDASRVLVFEPTAADLPEGPEHPAIEPMRRAPEGRRLLYVGSSSGHKDLPTLRKALWLLRRSGVDAELFMTLAPDDPMAKGEGIHALGYLDEQSALRQAYEAADVLVLASREETVGLPLVEAMHFGRAIVAPDLAYARDVCRDAALYFKPRDPRAAADALRTLLSDPALRRSLGERGRALDASRTALRPYQRMLESLRSAEAAPSPASSERHARTP